MSAKTLWCMNFCSNWCLDSLYWPYPAPSVFRAPPT